jgi:hypothetical protein
MRLNNILTLAAVLVLALAPVAAPACSSTTTVTAAAQTVTVTSTATVAPTKVMPSETNPLVIDPVNREIRIAGKVNGVGFTQPSWHILVYTGGKAAGSSPFLSYVNPAIFFNALSYFGGVPGNNMPVTNYASLTVKGSAVDMYVTWEGASKTYKLSEVTKNPGTKDVALRFGGNYDQNAAAGTGCLACYYSCPFGIVSNSAYNGDDNAAQGKTGQGGVLLDKSVLPADGTPVTLIFKVTP